MKLKRKDRHNLVKKWKDGSFLIDGKKLKREEARQRKIKERHGKNI